MPIDRSITINSRVWGGIVGMLAGQFGWAVMFLGALACPGPIFTPIAVPLSYFAHVFIWPNALAPPSLAWWIDSDASAYTFGLGFYGLIGAIIGAYIGWYPKWRFSLRTLLIATTLVAIAVGLIALASK